MSTSDKAASTDFRTPESIRALLAESLDKLKKGKMTHQTANSIANLSGKVFYSYRIQVEYARHTGRVASIPELEGSMLPKA